MDLTIISKRLQRYDCSTKQKEKQALREIAHTIALCALSRSDFFKHAGFVGGSALRILYGLNRFSEDLDFWTVKPLPDFAWKQYLQDVVEEFKSFGFEMEILDRGELNTRIKRAFLKKDSIGKLLLLTHSRGFEDGEKLQIKFEIDTHPPSSSCFEPKQLQFPQSFILTSLDRPSLFASKIAAAIDPKQNKGRHWYDFAWYISQKWPLNLQLLGETFGQNIATPSGLIERLIKMISSIDWKEMKRDVLAFLPDEEMQTVDLWNAQFFLGYVEALEEYLRPKTEALSNIISTFKGTSLLKKVENALRLGADVNDDSQNGRRPLQVALSNGTKEIAKLLIEQGADLNYRDRSGLTPLQTAINHRHFEIGKLLIQKGAQFSPHASNLAFDQVKLYEFLLYLKKG